MKHKTKWESKEIRERYPDDKKIEERYAEGMDLECIPLCDAINKFPGICTMESCCGHSDKPFRIWLRSDDDNSLAALLFDVSYQRHGWSVEVYTDGCGAEPTYMIEGPIGEYSESYDIAKSIEDGLPEWLAQWIWIGDYEFKSWDHKDKYFWTGRKRIDGYTVTIRDHGEESLKVRDQIKKDGLEIVDADPFHKEIIITKAN